MLFLCLLHCVQLHLSLDNGYFQLQWQVLATTPYARHGSIWTCLADLDELALVTVSYAWFGFISISRLFRLSGDMRSKNTKRSRDVRSKVASEWTFVSARFQKCTIYWVVFLLPKYWWSKMFIINHMFCTVTE